MKGLVVLIGLLVGVSQAQAGLKGAYVEVGQQNSELVFKRGDKEHKKWHGVYVGARVGYAKVKTKKIGYALEGSYFVKKTDFSAGRVLNLQPSVTYGLNRAAHVYAGVRVGMNTWDKNPLKVDDSLTIAAPRVWTTYGAQVGVVARVHKRVSLTSELAYRKFLLTQEGGKEIPEGAAETTGAGFTLGVGLRYSL